MKNELSSDYSVYQEESGPLMHVWEGVEKRLEVLEAEVAGYKEIFEQAKVSKREVSKETKAYGEALKEIERLTKYRQDIVSQITELASHDIAAREFLENHKSEYIN